MRAFARRDPTDSMPAALRVTGLGHEERFPPTRLSAGYGFRKETIAGMRRNGRDAPIPAIRITAMEPGVKRSREIRGRAQDRRVADETVIRTRRRTGRRLAHAS
jgi:hypothetical protein